MTRQCPLQPNKEEIRKIGIGNSVVVRRIGEPKLTLSRRQRVTRSVCQLDLSALASIAGKRLNDCAIIVAQAVMNSLARFRVTHSQRNPTHIGIACHAE